MLYIRHGRTDDSVGTHCARYRLERDVGGIPVGEVERGERVAVAWRVGDARKDEVVPIKGCQIFAPHAAGHLIR